MLRTFLILCLTLVATAAGCAKEASRTPSAEPDVRAASAAWDAEHNAGNTAGLVALYAEDAVSMPYDRPALEGRAAIEADFRAFFAGHTARHVTTIVSLDIDGDRAVEHGRYTLEVVPRSGEPGIRESGKHIVVRRRIDDAWLVTHEIWNRDGAVGP